MKILKRKTLAALLCLSLLVGLLPVGAAPALAEVPEGMTIYVGDETITSAGYWTTDSEGKVTPYTGEGTPADNYIRYDAADNTLTLHNATIKESVSSNTYVMGAGIGVFNKNDASKLTIKLEGSNAIENVSTGICVLAFSYSTGDASLTITGSGSLDTSGRNNPAIRVQSNGGNATLSIENAKVTATASGSGYGVLVQSKNDSSVSLTVDGGSLTATGKSELGAGIRYTFGGGTSGSGRPSLTVSNNAIVRANGSAGGITSNSSAEVQTAAGTGESGGIVFDNGTGTVYGDVTLQENITINEGESLTIGDGASLNAGSHNVIVDGGTLDSNLATSLGNSVIYKVISVSLNKNNLTLDVGKSETLTATITPSNATNQNVTWESSDSNGIVTISPDTADSKNATITATGAGTTTIKATVDEKSAECSVTVKAPTTILVTGVSLNKASTTLTVGDTETLTATVAPEDATNKAVTWSSNDSTVATVDESGKVTAVAPGEATITVTTEDGSKTATCTVIVHTATTITTQPQSVSVTEGQSATFSVTVTGDNLRYQWQLYSGNSWSDITGATDASYTIDRTTTAMSGNQYRCIVTGDGGEVTSDAAMLTVNERPIIPPVIPPTVSEETIDAILDAEPGETVSVALEDGDTTLDAEVFETLAGQDITLEIALEGGVTWTVNGQDIPADANLSDLDLGVEMDSDGIPVDVVNSITGERGTVQMTLAHDGDFGFTMTLTAPLGVENAGYWANLYHYDEDADQLTFETAAEIDADGSVSLSLSHASQYAIVIDDHSHATIDLPFSDVSDSDWFYDPVVWIYNEGLMTGTSATTFEPNTSTTRAMIVAMLARLENVTSADSAGFTDVSGSDWYATAVNWAASEGIVGGFGDGSFQPNAPITREQMASILYRYAAYKGDDVSARADLNRYADAPSAWAEDVLSWAVAEGLLTGVTNDQLQPQGNATRAQVAAILERFLAE